MNKTIHDIYNSNFNDIYTTSYNSDQHNSKETRGKLPCPSCPSSDGLSEYDDGHTYCFSCLTYTRGDVEVKHKEIETMSTDAV